MTKWHLKKNERKGHFYYTINRSVRRGADVKTVTIEYLGRLDNITVEQKNELENKVRMLGDSKLLGQFWDKIYRAGYRENIYPIAELNIPNLEDFGDVAAQHQIFKELDIVNIINAHTYKGGGTFDVGRLTEIMAINRNSDPCSRRKIPTWYANTALPLLLAIKPSEIYGRILLRALTYLQEENTIPIQMDIYNKIKQIFGYEPTKVYYDITSTYFEGTCCSLAKYGHSSDKRKDKLQIVLGFVIDNEGILITHSVHEGNTVGVETVEDMAERLKKEFGITDSVLVMDRGMTSATNIKILDENKQKYVMAHELDSAEKKMLEKALETETWKEIKDGTKAAVVIITENDRVKKYVFVHKQQMEYDDHAYREQKLQKAEIALGKVLASIRFGKVKVQDVVKERVGHILREREVTKFFEIEYKKRGVGFTYTRNKNVLQSAEKYDGYYTLCTTEEDMDPKEIIQTYRERDLLEKAIRTLKSVLDLRPIYAHGPESIRGHAFVCALAYQIRSVMSYKLRKANTNMNVDKAFEHLVKLKIVNLVFDGNKVKVFRKFSSENGAEQKLLIDVFDLGAEMKKLTV